MRDGETATGAEPSCTKGCAKAGNARIADDDLLAARDLNSPDERKRALYAAFASHDARFDGQVFVGVSSTRIYCRPVCSARMPKYENCTFFHSPAEAEAAGYRPCMTCRPEIAPGSAPVDARSNLARRAAALLREDCARADGIERIAARLGYTGRHLRRVFEEEFSVTPVQYLQTCRLLLAKSLLTDTALPVAQVARAAGFGSVRRMNALFRERYRLTPSDLRKRGRKTETRTDAASVKEADAAKGTAGDTASAIETGFTVRLSYRPPYEFGKLLGFFRARALAGVEVVGDDFYLRSVRVPLTDGAEARGWVRVENDARRNALAVTLSESLLPALSPVIARIRRQFDVDCDPQAIFERIFSLDDAVPGAAVLGTRLPGCFDPFETAVRAVLGQQVTVAAANKLAARIAKTHGTPTGFGDDRLSRFFPTAAEVLSLDPVEDALGTLGVIKTRSRTIAEIARLMEAGELDLGPGANAREQMERLLAVKGIGPWSANYIAMRTMSYPDAFLETDAGIKHALPDLTPKERLALAERWRPWRSYANVSLWNSLG